MHATSDRPTRARERRRSSGGVRPPRAQHSPATKSMACEETGHSEYGSRVRATPALRPMPVHMAWDLEA